jgi:hypothetical protein
VIGFFRYERLATNNSNLNSCNSFFDGWVSIVSPTSTAVSIAKPQMGCRLATEDIVPVTRVRGLDVGNLKLASAANPANSGTLERDPENNFDFNALGIFMVAGHYVLENLSAPTGISFKKDFRVTGEGSNFTISSGSYANQPLATPVLALPSDAGGTARARRDSDFTVGFQPPLGTDYTTVRIYDNIAVENRVSVVCYVPGSETSATIPAELMARLSVSEHASLWVNFHAADIHEDVAKVKELVIDASQRHVHGAFVAMPPTNNDSCGEPSLFEQGQLILE